VSRGIAINVWQAADFLFLLQVMISANINVYQKRVLIITLQLYFYKYCEQ
jgi:hypothetical protein